MLLQIPVMREIFSRCDSQQVKWLLRVIIKDLKVKWNDVLHTAAGVDTRLAMRRRCCELYTYDNMV